MIRRFNPKTDRPILDDVCKSTQYPSLAAIQGAFHNCGIEWPIMSPMWSYPSGYAKLVDREITEAWIRRGWLKVA